MKILHVGVGNLGPGGVATYVDLVTKGLRERGHEVELAELWPAPDLPAATTMTFGDIPYLLEYARTHPTDAIHLHSQLPSYDGLPDNCLITAHEHSAHCPGGSRYLERPRKICNRPFGTIGCTLHHFLDRCGSRDPRSMRRRFEVTSRSELFRGIWIAPSEYSRRMLALRGIPPARTRFVPNPGPEPKTPATSDPSGPSRNSFLFIGRLVPSKGCDVAIRATATSTDLRLRIVGDGPQRDELQALARKLGVLDRVSFQGWQPRQQVEAELRASLGLVVPSLWPEPFGLVALEAFSNGVPVIASRAGGLVDIVEPGVNGLLVEPGSVRQLARAMGDFLEDPSLSDRLGMAGNRTLADRFALGTHLDRLEELYAEASKAGGNPEGRTKP
ncbi:MAG TPA: glycosyltransferase family 4 protein [Fibrobacteria bacterium]|nr:glycosyltransferase family 4 protein [Fibrobacteria bacterium]